MLIAAKNHLKSDFSANYFILAEISQGKNIGMRNNIDGFIDISRSTNGQNSL